jgi:hypothetical protein
MSNDNKPFQAGATDPFMGYVAPGDEALPAWVPEHLRSGGVTTITDADYGLPIFGGESSDDQSNPLWTMDDLINPNVNDGPIFDDDETEEEIHEPTSSQSVKDKGTQAQSSKAGAAEGSKSQENTAQLPKQQTPKQDDKPKKPPTPAQLCEICNAEIPSRRAHWARRCYKCDIDGLYRRDDDLMLFQTG